MKRVITTGRTVEDAVTSALVKLGVTRTQATIKVLSEPVKGLFGLIGAKDAQVEVSVQATPEELAREFLLGLTHRMGIEVKVRSHADEEDGKTIIYLDMTCEEQDLSVVIGRHGSTLDSLQHLVNVVANRENTGYVKFYVDAGDYRKRRREGLHRLADRAATRAVRSHRAVAMEPMSAADRKIIHTYLQERTDVSTTSEGTEPDRRVLVVPVVGAE